MAHINTGLPRPNGVLAKYIVFMACSAMSVQDGAAAGLLERWKFPHARGMSVIDAVTTSVWQTAKKKSYFEVAAAETKYMWTIGSPLVPERLCTATAIRDSDGVACAIAIPGFDQCPNDDCIGLRIDPSVLRDEAFGLAIESAIKEPCKALQRPADFHRYSPQFNPNLYGLYYTIEHAWSFLDCQTGTPIKPQLHRRGDNELMVIFSSAEP